MDKQAINSARGQAEKNEYDNVTFMQGKNLRACAGFRPV
jgi:hypothetical protein